MDKLEDKEFEELRVTAAMVNAFLTVIGDAPFVLADVADTLKIGPAEALAIFTHITENDILQFQCMFIPIRKQ